MKFKACSSGWRFFLLSVAGHSTTRRRSSLFFFSPVAQRSHKASDQSRPLFFFFFPCVFESSGRQQALATSPSSFFSRGSADCEIDGGMAFKILVSSLFFGSMR